MPDASLPVVVIGAGPVGLTAAAHLLARGLNPLVLEAGAGPGHEPPHARGAVVRRVRFDVHDRRAVHEVAPREEDDGPLAGARGRPHADKAAE